MTPHRHSLRGTSHVAQPHFDSVVLLVALAAPERAEEWRTAIQQRLRSIITKIDESIEALQRGKEEAGQLWALVEIVSYVQRQRRVPLMKELEEKVRVPDIKMGTIDPAFVTRSRTSAP